MYLWCEARDLNSESLACKASAFTNYANLAKLSLKKIVTIAKYTFSQLTSGGLGWT